VSTADAVVSVLAKNSTTGAYVPFELIDGGTTQPYSNPEGTFFPTAGYANLRNTSTSSVCIGVGYDGAEGSKAVITFVFRKSGPPVDGDEVNCDTCPGTGDCCRFPSPGASDYEGEFTTGFIPLDHSVWYMRPFQKSTSSCTGNCRVQYSFGIGACYEVHEVQLSEEQVIWIAIGATIGAFVFFWIVFCILMCCPCCQCFRKCCGCYACCPPCCYPSSDNGTVQNLNVSNDPIRMN